MEKPRWVAQARMAAATSSAVAMRLRGMVAETLALKSGPRPGTKPVSTTPGETAITRTAGIVFSPASVPGFSLALDWFNIQVDNRITAIGAGYVINQCYVSGVPQFCSQLKRDPVTGQIVELITSGRSGSIGLSAAVAQESA